MSKSIEKFSANVAKLSRVVAQLSTTVNQLEATLAMTEKGQEIIEFKVKSNAAVFSKDIIDQKLEDTKEKERKSGPLLSHDLSVDNPHIDFIFGDQKWKLRNCNLMVQILHKKHPKVRSRSQRKFGHQKKQCVKTTWNWRR